MILYIKKGKVLQKKLIESKILSYKTLDFPINATSVMLNKLVNDVMIS